MQKRPNSNLSVDLLEVTLSDDFPIDHVYHIQKESNKNKLHFHNLFEIGLCLEGSGLFFVENNVTGFNSNDISFIYPDQPHIAQSYAQLPSRWVFITVDITRLLGENSVLISLEQNKDNLKNIIKMEENPPLNDIVNLIIKELDNKQTGYKSVVRSLVGAFCTVIMRCSDNAITGKTKISSRNIIVSPALNYISANYDVPMDIATLAKLCSVSVTHFRRVFKETTKHTPLEYLTKVRLKMAKTILVSSDIPIAEIAYAVGFGSISSFNRQFKQEYKIAPKMARINKSI